MAEKQYVQPEDHLGNQFVFPTEAKVVKMEDGSNLEDTIKNIKESQTSSKSKTYQMTMQAANWTGDEAPYTLELAVAGVTANNNVDIVPQASTEEQIDAWQGLGYMLGSQETNRVIIKSWGDKPTVDIPITVIVRGD